MTVIKLNGAHQDIPGVLQCCRNYSVPQHTIVGNLVQSEVQMSAVLRKFLKGRGGGVMKSDSQSYNDWESVGGMVDG